MGKGKHIIKVGFITERMLLGYGVDLEIHKAAGGLAGLGYDVTVFSNLIDSTYRDSKYKLEAIPTARTPLFPRYEWRALKWRDFFNQQDIDVYIVETFPYYSCLPFIKKHTIAVDHGVCPTTGFPLWLKLSFAYMAFNQYRLYFKYADRIVTISESIKRDLPKGLQAKAKVIYEGIDHYSPSDSCEDGGRRIRRRFGVNDDEILLLYVGRLDPQGQPYKGVKELIEIYQAARKQDGRIRMLAVGLGGQKDETMLRRSEIIPYVNAPSEEMPSIFQSCDIYVTGSKWEGFDLPLVEAHFFGKPGIAFQVGAHPEVTVNGQTSFLVDSKEEFVKALLLLVEDKQKRLDMGESAREHASKFKWAKVVKAYDELIQEVVN